MASQEGHDPSTLVLETRMLPITLPTHKFGASTGIRTQMNQLSVAYGI